jgi:hypothetical protein
MGLMEKDEAFGKVKLVVLLEKRFGDKYSAVPYNKKLYVTVIGLSCEEQTDCPLPTIPVTDHGEENNKKWMDLKKSLVRAAAITLMMQEKEIIFLKEPADKQRSEALKVVSAPVSITTATRTATVLATVAMPTGHS